MPGQTRRLIDAIIAQRSKGNATIASALRTKMILKGISPDKFTLSTPDQPELLIKLQAMAVELGVRL